MSYDGKLMEKIIHRSTHSTVFYCRAWLWYSQAYSTRLWCYSAVYYSNVGGFCWIGLYKSRSKASNSVTYWLDGNNSTYRNWHTGEPDSKDRCVFIKNDGKFIDTSCGETNRYICKGIYFC